MLNPIRTPRLVTSLPRDVRDPLVEEHQPDPTPPQLRLSVVEVLERLVDRDGVEGVRAGYHLWATKHGIDL